MENLIDDDLEKSESDESDSDSNDSRLLSLSACLVNINAS